MHCARQHCNCRSPAGVLCTVARAERTKRWRLHRLPGAYQLTRALPRYNARNYAQF
jgi:hypothetical protein